MLLASVRSIPFFSLDAQASFRVRRLYARRSCVNSESLSPELLRKVFGCADWLQLSARDTTLTRNP